MLSKELRRFINKKQERIFLKKGSPSINDLKEGIPVIRETEDGIVMFIRHNNSLWKSLFTKAQL